MRSLTLSRLVARETTTATTFATTFAAATTITTTTSISTGTITTTIQETIFFYVFFDAIDFLYSFRIFVIKVIYKQICVVIRIIFIFSLCQVLYLNIITLCLLKIRNYSRNFYN